MSLLELLNHKCDIYHLVKNQVSPGFALPASPKFSYSDVPDISEQTCHFATSSNSSISINQTQPINEISARIKLTLPIDVDIRLNDKIIDCDTGAEYTAEIPRKVREHHIYVFVQKVEEQRNL